MVLHRFTAKGLEAFNEFLSELNANHSAPVPSHLLTSREYSIPVSGNREIQARNFKTSYEFAEYLVEEVEIGSISELEYDSRLWSWLALLFFELLCPATPGGERIPRDRARLVFSPEGRSLFRHQVAGPVFVYLTHHDNPSRAIPLLCDPVHLTGTLFTVLTDRYNLLRSPGVVEAAGKLYYDTKRERIRHGAKTNTPGRIIRFATVLFQLDATWDLQSLTGNQVISLLPAEFDKYKAFAK